MEEMLQSMEQWVGEKEVEVSTIIGGDFNARTGEEGGGIEIGKEGEEGGGKGEGRRRKSKDRKMNREGKVMVEFLEERGWGILNGCIEGEEEGEYTFTGGKGNTVIDYVIADEDTRGKIKRLRIGDNIESDHQPVEVWVKGEGQRQKRKRNESREKGKIWRGVWNEEGCKKFKQRMEGLKSGEEEMRVEWEGMERKMKEAIKEVERDVGKEEGKRRGWWDRECEEKKKEARRELRGWRRKGGEGKEYKEKKKEYKETCERKKKEENERWEKRAREVKRENEVWEIVNRERKRRTRINDGIGMEEWKEYFMRLLGGTEGKVVKGGERKKGGEGEEEEEISRKEIKEAIKKLRNGKAMGVDGIPGEAWKYGGEEVEEWVWSWCNRVWRGEGWPERWKEGVVVPIRKKGEGEKVEDYRGVTLMSSCYKIYTITLAERLRREVEEKGIVPQSQTGFREGMGTLDNIYVLNYLVNRQLGKKKGKMTALFIDLKAAFDSVDRGILVGAMRERGVREGLVERVEEVLKETKSKVRVGGEEGGNFWTARGVRQGCPLSPLIFNVMLADIEEEMGKVKWGGVKLRGRKIYSLAYADDMVLIAEEEEEMKGMMERLERYLDRKNLELNTEKTKIMRFRKGGGRWRKKVWRWKGKIIEEVKEFRYLGYIIQRNGGQGAQIRERVRKATTVMGQVWGIGKRRFGKDWGRRLWLFDKLVWTVMGYGAEIWGWKEREEMERAEERYLRWVLGVEARTPGYLVREELQREKLRGRAGRRAWRFEKRLDEGRGSEIARECREEMKERFKEGRVRSEWEEERRKFLEEREISIEEVEKKKEKGEARYEELERRDKEKQRKERREKISESRFSRWYKEVKGEGIPDYLKKGWGESRWKRVARFRLGNEVREGRYWEEEEKRRCRLCGGERETWEHVWEECREWKEGGGSWQEAVGWVLGEEGEGERYSEHVLSISENGYYISDILRIF
ncbi:LINE-1 retrotransposable element ORF2 protein [Linepithema humile]|uniref:LINE-1 retrotransposable element ORF2 protein n=1 Tax=Linepithema humile TaxID=83485 RepID=UPI00351EDCA2